MLPTRFVKMSGGGNDFLVFEADGRRLSDEDRRILALLCRRGLSVGADGALFLSGGEQGRIHLDYFNADGGLAAFCANGSRCAARYATRRRLAAGAELVLETGWGAIGARVEGEQVTLTLPPLPAPGEAVAISGAGLPAEGVPMHVGVPHLVVFVGEELAGLPLAELAPPLRHHPLFPEGANVNFVRVAGPDRLEIRTWERGVEGETLACGSGVVASAIVASSAGMVAPPVVCATRSGVDFIVNFGREGRDFRGATLTGDAREIFTAELTEEAWSR